MVIQNCAANGRIEERAIVWNLVRVNDVLVVVRIRQIDDLAGVAQTNRCQSFDFACMQCEQNFFDVRECASFALRTRLAFGQVIKTEDHVLRGHGDRLA